MCRRSFVLLAAVRDPGNAGTVLRTADAAGASAVVFSDNSVDPYNGKCVRASAGSVFHLPIVVGEPVARCDSRVAVGGASGFRRRQQARCRSSLDELERDGRLAQPTTWVFGNEAWGLPADVVQAADVAVRVPIYGRAESLNLAAAAAVCLYASARARRRSPCDRSDAQASVGRVRPPVRRQGTVAPAIEHEKAAFDALPDGVLIADETGTVVLREPGRRRHSCAAASTRQWAATTARSCR